MSALSRIAAKVAVSMVFGLVAFSLSSLLDAKVEPSVVIGLGVSIFISGVAFITQFLVDVENRIDVVESRLEDVGRVLQVVESRYEKHYEELREMIKDEFVKINSATELFGAVEASALRADAITQLVRNSTSVSKATPSLIFDFAQAEIARLSSYLKDLGQEGDVTYEGEDRDWLLGLTRVATTTIEATSLSTVDAGGQPFVDGGLWNSDLGQQYLDAQRDAVGRGVVIRRIFIVDRPELQNDEHFNNILRSQADAGILVRTLKPDDMAWTKRRSSLIDFIVMDGVLSYQATPASHTPNRPPTIASTTLVTNSVRVQERVERYKALWAAATPFGDS